MIIQDKINIRFERDKQIIVDNILSVFQIPPKAIILCGGYGRGEGAWYEDSKGEISPYNDYDIAVITETPFSRDTYKVLRKKIADEVGIRWIDIDCYTTQQINRFKPTIHNIDLYEGSTLLWGDSMWSKDYKSLDKTKIGREDLLKLYRTRMWTLLGSWVGNFHDIEGEDARFFRNQMAKSILASCDMRLIRLKKYNSSYRLRVESVCEFFPQEERICRLAKWAIKEKMNPSCEKLLKEEMMQLYYDAYTEFRDSFSFAMKDKARYYLTPTLTDSYIKYHTLHLAYCVYGRLRGMGNLVTKSHDLFIAQNYVLNAFRADGSHNKQYINVASGILQKWDYLNRQESDWDKIRIIVANARNNI